MAKIGCIMTTREKKWSKLHRLKVSMTGKYWEQKTTL
jgi:hypothetical protein